MRFQLLSICMSVHCLVSDIRQESDVPSQRKKNGSLSPLSSIQPPYRQQHVILLSKERKL